MRPPRRPVAPPTPLGPAPPRTLPPPPAGWGGGGGNSPPTRSHSPPQHTKSTLPSIPPPLHPTDLWYAPTEAIKGGQAAGGAVRAPRGGEAPEQGGTAMASNGTGGGGGKKGPGGPCGLPSSRGGHYSSGRKPCGPIFSWGGSLNFHGGGGGSPSVAPPGGSL